MKKKAKDAILALVEKERDGEQIDRTLLKNVLVRNHQTLGCYLALARIAGS